MKYLDRFESKFNLSESTSDQALIQNSTSILWQINDYNIFESKFSSCDWGFNWNQGEKMFDFFKKEGKDIFILESKKNSEHYLILEKDKGVFQIFDCEGNQSTINEINKKHNIDLFKELGDILNEGRADHNSSNWNLFFEHDNFQCFEILNYEAFSELCTEEECQWLQSGGKKKFNQLQKKGIKLYLLLSKVPVYDPKSYLEIYVSPEKNIWAQDRNAHLVNLVQYLTLMGLKMYYSWFIQDEPKRMYPYYVDKI